MENKNLIEATESNFEDILKNHPKVLLDFWAPWCNPCKAMAQIVAEVVTNDDICPIVKVNVDENSAITQKYGVRAIPTFILIEAGAVVATKAGSMSKTDLHDFIKNK